MRNSILLIFVFLNIAGCARVTDTATETVKGIWGSSTRALENARIDSIGKTYDCTFDACFDAVAYLGQESGIWSDQVLVQEGESITPSVFEQANRENVGFVEIKERKFFLTFIKDRPKQHIVFMRVPGSVNSTEVGVFFTPLEDKRIRVEVSSLSRYAKKTVADIVFGQLDKVFPAQVTQTTETIQ